MFKPSFIGSAPATARASLAPLPRPLVFHARDYATRADRVGGMEQRRLGATGLYVSRLALGTMTWGRDTDEDDASSQLKAFLERGAPPIAPPAVYSDAEG